MGGRSCFLLWTLVALLATLAGARAEDQDAPIQDEASASSASDSPTASAQVQPQSTPPAPSSAKKKRSGDYLTEYACEGSRLNISCTDGGFLDVIRANYGRFSISVCNDHGETEWSVNCMSPRTLRVIKARCGNQESCDVPVDSTIFGDPCPGTFKYVEVHYTCRSEPSSPKPSTLSRPPWFPPSEEEDGVNEGTKAPQILPAIDKADLKKSGNLEKNPKDGDLGSDTTPRVIEVRVPKPFDAGNFGVGVSPRKNGRHPHLPLEIPSVTTTARNPIKNSIIDSKGGLANQPTLSTSTEPIQVMVNFTQYCQPATVRGLHWNWTKAGDTAVLQCPSGSTGFAKWSCSPLSTWQTQSPSLRECRSLWLGDLDRRLRGGSSAAPVAANVSRSLAYHSGLRPMYGGDIIDAARMLKHLAERMNYEMQRTPSLDERERMVTDLVQNVVRAGSHVVDRMNHRSWGDLGRDESGRAATALMVGLEENAFLLADAVTSEKIIIKPTDNVLLSIRVMQARNAARQRFPSVESLDSWAHDHGDSVELSAESLHRSAADNGAVRVVFAAYNQLDRLLSPRKKRGFQNVDDDDGLFVNSKVISASVGRGRHAELPDPARITFKHLRTINASHPECVYWDYLSDGWSDDGCRVEDTNRTHTVCLCSHLTNFALLMRDGGGGDFMSVATEPLTKSSEATSAAGATKLGTHVSLAVLGLAVVVIVTVVLVFLAYTWNKTKMSQQCRSALERSGLPCFHKGKDLDDKDKGNKGNFYTVTPKMNGVGSTMANSAAGQQPNDPPEVVEAQQFFEHMINLKKNEGTMVQNRRKISANGGQSQSSDQQETALNEEGKGGASDPSYPRRTTAVARALSPYNHIYMEIDPTDGPDGGQAVYEPLTHSETYMMSTVSDLSENDYGGLGNGGVVNFSDVSRQSSSRESRPLIARSPMANPQGGERNLLHTISGVLHSQSVRLNNNHNNHHHINHAAQTLNPARRSMLVTTKPQVFFQQQQQQHPQLASQQLQGSQTLGRLAGQRLFRDVPLVDRLRQNADAGNAIPMQQIVSNGGGATLRKLPENSIISKLLQEQQQQQQQQLSPQQQLVTMNGNQFILQQQQQQPLPQHATYVTGTCSDTYVPFLPPTSAPAQANLVVSPRLPVQIQSAGQQ